VRGWEWPLPKEIVLERLVVLHDERVWEEKAGKVRWFLAAELLSAQETEAILPPSGSPPIIVIARHVGLASQRRPRG
jgi:hypothetical protein